MRKILIVGGCGFVGTNLALRLSQNDNTEVTCVDNLSRFGSQYNYDLLKSDSDVTLMTGEGMQFIEHFNVNVPDIILNCAAQSGSMNGYSDPVRDYESNTTVTLKCLELCRRYSIPMIQWSTNKVYPNQNLSDGALDDCPINAPRGIYGVTKMVAESLITEWYHSFGVSSIINRFSCLAGPHQFSIFDQAWFTLWVIHHVFNKPLKIYGFDGNQTRDVLSVHDMCELIEKQVDYLLSPVRAKDPTHRIYNVGGGQHNVISLNEMTSLCRRLCNQSSTIIYESKSRPFDQKHYVSDIEEVCRDFQWNPTTTTLGTANSVYNWVIENKDKLEKLYK